jgi:copper chaperone CopZ
MTVKLETQSLAYSVPGMSCEHCRAAITAEVGALAGVQAIDVDLETKLVTVHGAGIDSAAVVAAIDEAGYDAVRAGDAA